MPNHITNIISVSGKRERVDELFAFVKSDKSEFDFNKIVPMPESLRIRSGSAVDNAIAIITNDEQELGRYLDFEWVKEQNITTIKELKRFLSKRLKSKDFEEARIAINNLNKYGHKDWYSWSIANWDTKWNAYEIEKISDNKIKFETAWRTPFAVMEALAEMFFDLEIEVRFADEDIGSNCGVYYFEHGVVSGQYFPEGWKAVKFASRIKGCSEDFRGELAYRIQYMVGDEVDEEFENDVSEILNNFNDDNHIKFLKEVVNNCVNEESLTKVKEKLKQIALEKEIYEVMNKIEEIIV